MGGWLALLTALERPHRVHSVISIATAADYDKWLRQNCPEEVCIRYFIACLFVSYSVYRQKQIIA